LLFFLFLSLFFLFFFIGRRHQALLLDQEVLQIGTPPPGWAMLSLSILFGLMDQLGATHIVNRWIVAYRLVDELFTYLAYDHSTMDATCCKIPLVYVLFTF
jgi:hypothetical protein